MDLVGLSLLLVRVASPQSGYSDLLCCLKKVTHTKKVEVWFVIMGFMLHHWSYYCFTNVVRIQVNTCNMHYLFLH